MTIFKRDVLAMLNAILRFCARLNRVDDVDRHILAELQVEGRMSVTELAARVGLSVSACSRRLHDLHVTEVIAGYRAVVTPTALGLGFEVLAQVTMQREDADTVAAFEEGLATIPQVRHAERLFGDPDYLVRIATVDINAYQQLRDTRLARLPGVEKITSSIVMRRVVDDRPYVID